MSYQAPESSDSLSEFFSRLTDFYTVLPNLRKAETKDDFLTWYDKLERIDRRSLYIFLHTHKDELNPEFVDMVRYRFVREI